MISHVDLFNAELHYDLVSNWWRAQGWPVIPLSHLPMTGLVSFVDSIPAAAGWIYQTDSAFCLFEWMVANPEVRREARTEGINALFAQAKAAAKEMGFKTIFSTAKNPSLIGRFEKQGFTVSDQGMSNLFLKLDGGL